MRECRLLFLRTAETLNRDSRNTIFDSATVRDPLTMVHALGKRESSDK